MPLTTNGVAAQILGSIATYRNHPNFCSINDCKVVVNHLVRKFSEPLARLGSQQRIQSAAIQDGANDRIVDHAVPVIVIVEYLIDHLPTPLSINQNSIDQLRGFLTNSLVLVEITKREDAELSKKGFQRKMPASWHLSGGLVSGDPLARYRVAGINI